MRFGLKEENCQQDVVFDEAYILRKCKDEASTDIQKGKQVVEIKFDNQSSHG